MEINKIGILEEYYVKVTRLVINIIIISICIGSILFPSFKVLGCFNTMKWSSVIIFNLVIAFPEIFIFRWLYRNVVVDGRLVSKIFIRVKQVLSIVIFINYYGFTLLLPTGEFWYVSFYFIILAAFFLDIKMAVRITVGLIISMFLVCIINPLNVPSQEILLQEMLMRISIIGLTTVGIMYLVHFAGNILLNVKMEEAKYKEDYYEKVEENQKNIREIRHNLINQIIVLKSQVNEGNVSEANKIMDDIIFETQQNGWGIYTENVPINAILNAKINQGELYGVQWELDVKVPKDLNIDMRDIGTVLGNTLDNAIEACSMLENDDKLINVNIYCKNSNMTIYIKNPKNVTGTAINTWKKDKDNHGLGLKSVRKIVSKYNGIITNEDKNTYYEVNIMMWNV
ncbi:ATP-binding region ATPase domain protein [Clostridium sp. DL-VIII]|uniref:sensor histidine kinase n=1 Tax=Clostridium sp. DL-VIII TaxID=641107 RepID=UPI00023B03D3|nr:GHKL domain-containing protein [Clostridium sp. DL-VIII]EHJ02384.1 ATP-binding region ATPase domain protein [Clostridium sp. DL-VIII]